MMTRQLDAVGRSTGLYLRVTMQVRLRPELAGKPAGSPLRTL